MIIAGFYFIAGNIMDKNEKLKAELEQSRISVMLSQIQPHFLYNSLGVIQELCHENPQKAEKAIENMAEFLKGNMPVLLSDKVVSFGDELNHTKKYLEMEYNREFYLYYTEEPFEYWPEFWDTYKAEIIARTDYGYIDFDLNFYGKASQK